MHSVCPRYESVRILQGTLPVLQVLLLGVGGSVWRKNDSVGIVQAREMASRETAGRGNGTRRVTSTDYLID